MKRIVAALAACLVVAAPPVASAPKAEHLGECEFFWDIAITARGMAMERVPSETIRRVVWRIFVHEDQARVIEIGNAIVDAAVGAPMKERENAGVFAGSLKAACINGGDMDSVLGVKL